jgi:hypothetical protein
MKSPFDLLFFMARMAVGAVAFTFYAVQTPKKGNWHPHDTLQNTVLF